jgi:molecular chaperone HscB
MNLQSNDFELFELPVAYALDRQRLDERWKALQREVHPDRHAAADAQTQRQAMQWSVRINEAYQRLKDPLQRAAYLCELHGAPIQAENNTAMPAAFLIQQMEWREALESASTAHAVEDLADEVVSVRRRVLADLQHLADDQRDWAAMAGQVRALMFIERFAKDVDERLEQQGQ